MTIGIYLLKFQGTDFVYIGQSVNIEARFETHLANMRNNEASYKMQAAYTLFSTPELIILEEVSHDLLDERELFYITKHNSLEKGLNVINGTTPNNTRIPGYIPKNSKYSEIDYYNILIECITRPSLSNRDIADATGTDINTVGALRRLSSYKWLKTRYPEEYATLENLQLVSKKSVIKEKVSTITDKKTYPDIISPDGRVYKLVFGEVTKFAKAHGLNYTALNKVLNRKLDHVSGWTLI